MREAFIVLRLKKETGALDGVIVASEWPLTEIGGMPFANVLLMKASGSTFESAHARVLRHMTVRHPWVMRFLSEGERSVANWAARQTDPQRNASRRPSARRPRPRRRRLRVVVGLPRVIEGKV